MLAQYQPGRSRAASFLSGIILFLTLATLAYGANQKSATLPDDVAKGEVSTDPAIQKIAETALEAALTRHKASLGFVVVSDPHTGRVLAVANQDRMEVQSERTPHWALALRIGPASIAKAIVAAAAVEKGVTTYGEVHNCEKSKYRLGGQLYQDWKAFDKLTTADTVVHSSNICGIKVGQRLGADGLAEAFKAWGFGPGGTADGFPESRPGILPTLTAGDQDNFVATYSTGYGGNYTTAMETVQAFGAIANGGQLLKPQSSKTNVKPEVIRRVLSEENAKLTRAVLADVMVRGTAKDSASKQYELAGKTATGYSRTNVGHDTLGGDSNMAAFIGFGPVNSPRVVVLAVVENPTDRKGVHGSYHAAPLFKEVAEKTLRHLKVAAK